MFGTTFIEYTILIVRNSDGESKVVKKRYKDLLQYYQQLVSNEIITNHDDITFPERNSFAPVFNFTNTYTNTYTNTCTNTNTYTDNKRLIQIHHL